MKPLRRNERGQMFEAVFAAISLVVGLSIGTIILGNLFTASEQAATIIVVVPYANVNSTFADNTGVATNPDNGWAQYVENGATNAWNSGGYVTVTSTENDAITKTLDSGVWYQRVAISDVYDGVVSAATSFKFRVLDNDNAQSILVRGLLDNSTDNITLFSENMLESDDLGAWVTVDNNVASYVDAAGTYTLWLRVDMVGFDDGATNPTTAWSGIVGFDDASLAVSVDNITSEAALGALANIESLSWTGLGLLAVSIIVLAAVVIVGYVRLMGGKGAV